MSDLTWREDMLPGYQVASWELEDAELVEGEPEGATLTGSIVRHREPQSRRAILYLHGWNDYFFQTHMCDEYERWGFDFYAVELRRYGRNLQPGLLGGYITDLTKYFEELDRAYAAVAENHDEIVLVGHSTGGLVVSLWADANPGKLAGLILNSPWLDMHAGEIASAMVSAMVAPMAAWSPSGSLPLPVDNGNYQRSLHVEEDGEWDYDRNYKGHPTFSIRAAWLRAIGKAQDKVARGLSIDCPVLLQASDKSDFSREWGDSFLNSDKVLDADRISARGVCLAECVTIHRVTDGMHDLVLSRPQVRAKVFAMQQRWLRAFVGLS